MLAKPHRLAGFAVGAITMTAYTSHVDMNPFAEAGLILLGGKLGSFGGLCPDIDHPFSTISFKYRKLSNRVRRITDHRELTHTLLFPTVVVLCLAGLLFLGVPEWLVFTLSCYPLGYLMHLIQDTFTMGGIPWLYPFRRRKISLFPMKSGHWFEWVITVVLIVAFGCGASYLSGGLFGGISVPVGFLTTGRLF